MAVKSTRYLDGQGRVILPSHIRRALNLGNKSLVEVSLDSDGTIRIKPSDERCCICGENVEGKHRAEIKAGPETKLICYDCTQSILKHIMK